MQFHRSDVAGTQPSALLDELADARTAIQRVVDFGPDAAVQALEDTAERIDEASAVIRDAGLRDGDVTAVPSLRQLDTLRRAQLTQTAETLSTSVAAFDRLRAEPDVSDPLGDVAGYVRTIREDLDALEALGYREQSAP